MSKNKKQRKNIVYSTNPDFNYDFNDDVDQETLEVLAESNKRLATLYIKNEKPDVAVPLLIETIRIMSPNTAEGKKAYKTLIQLGFVETTYKG